MTKWMKTVTVLLVEDDDVDVLGIRRAFKKHKIANPLVIAHDGIEALARLRGEEGLQAVPRPFVVLLDLNMPRMNGIEFLTEIRKDPDLADALVFMLTTSSSDEDRLAAYSKHIAGYIVKSRAGEDFINLVNLLESYWRVVEFP